MKYCEDCKYLTRYGSGIAGDYAVCALTKYVVIGKSYACDGFAFKKLLIKNLKTEGESSKHPNHDSKRT